MNDTTKIEQLLTKLIKTQELILKELKDSRDETNANNKDVLQGLWDLG